MIYPNTQPSGVVGGTDNKRKLQQMLSKQGAAPLFGGSGRSASAMTLPAIGSPALSFNPFLKMLAGHPGETLENLSVNNPLNGFVGSSVPTTSGLDASGVAGQAPPAMGDLTPSSGPSAPPSGTPTTNPFDQAAANYSPGGHYNDTWIDPNSPDYQQALASTLGVYAQPQASPNPAQALQSQGISASNPLYHTLLQLSMYGLDS